MQGLVAGGAVAGLNLLRWSGSSAEASPAPANLYGSHFDLAVEETPVNFTGHPSIATAINGTVPGPILHWREGDTVTIAVTNHLKEHTSIHWHGLRVPAAMDGVPGLSFAGIMPNETFVYRFLVHQSGTYWYHSHSGFQEQVGHYGAIVIEPRGKDPVEYDRDYVVLLSEWTDQQPEMIVRNLKQQSDYYNYHQRTAGTFVSDVGRNGLRATLADRFMWNTMNMSPTDILDVSGATYTYLVNGMAPGANWTGLFQPGQRIRLRFINASSMSIFDVRIPGLPMTVVQTDGNDVEPVVVDEFRISVAETYDVIVEPKEASAYTIFVQSEDRTGYARGTLATRSGMSAPVAPMDPRPLRTMVDMGMSHAMMTGSPGREGQTASEHTSMPGMEMGGMEGETGRMPAMTSMRRSPATAQSTTLTEMLAHPPGQPGPNVEPLMPGPSEKQTSPTPRPFILREGPQVDNVAQAPTERLNQPGIGLNDNGRRVLTYADLRARYRGVDLRPPTRDIELHLTGNMERFIWGFDGKKFSEADPIELKLGERVRFILVNDTMMEHPIHLHGLWSELENGHGDFRPYKHTLMVKAGERLSYLVSADTPGEWAYHCHLLYHMELGMFRKVVVS